jgi:hypothetical protein
LHGITMEIKKKRVHGSLETDQGKKRYDGMMMIMTVTNRCLVFPCFAKLKQHFLQIFIC